MATITCYLEDSRLSTQSVYITTVDSHDEVYLYNFVFQLHVGGRWFSLGILFSSTNTGSLGNNQNSVESGTKQASLLT